MYELFNGINWYFKGYICFRQEEDANEIASIANQAFGTSQDAYNMAFAALALQANTSNELQVLEEQVSNLEI